MSAFSPQLNLRIPGPIMTLEERAHLIKLLQDSQTEFLSCVEGVREAQWNWKPAPDRWSVGEIAEHIMVAESVIFAFIHRAFKSPANPDWQTKTAGKTELLEKEMPDRTRKATAPEQLRPRGVSKAEVVQRFKEVRAQTIHFAETTQAPLKEHTTDHPFPVFNTLNAHQWLLLVPLHNLRHDQQIAEVKATPGYPK
jgi:hypothetical protein